MVAGVSRIKSTSFPGDARCEQIREAIRAGQQYGGIDSLDCLHALGDDPTLGDVNISVADQPITVEHTGCIPEHESEKQETRVIPALCPDIKSERCVECIRNSGVFDTLYDGLVAQIERRLQERGF